MIVLQRDDDLDIKNLFKDRFGEKMRIKDSFKDRFGEMILQKRTLSIMTFFFWFCKRRTS